MPSPIFSPLAKNREITFETVLHLCERFETSLIATAIRLVESGSYPSMVVCTTNAGIKWKFRDRDVPDEIQLRDRPSDYTNASELLSDRLLKQIQLRSSQAIGSPIQGQATKALWRIPFAFSRIPCFHCCGGKTNNNY